MEATTVSDATHAHRNGNTLCMLLHTLPYPLLLTCIPTWELNFHLHACTSNAVWTAL